MKAFLLQVCTIILVVNGAIAQTAGIKFEEIIKPSANAANLGIYGSYPVSYYKGLPNISIPLYTISEKGYNCDVTLDYHASGIKVDQSPGFVGLGWVLNGGGVVVRNQRGNFDERYQSGYIEQSTSGVGFKLTPEVWNQVTSTYSSPLDVKDDDERDWYFGADTEPDEFLFNFCGKSGKFMLDRNGLAVTDSKIKITYTWFLKGQPGQRINGWEIVGEDGVRYVFEQNEKIVLINTGGYGWRGGGGAGGGLSANVTTAWYLTKIIAPDGQLLIEFQYRNHLDDSPSMNSNEVTIKEFAANYISSTYGYNTQDYQTVESNVTTEAIHLSKIISSNVEVLISTEHTQSASSPIRLTNLRIQKKDGTEIKTYQFHYQPYQERNIENGTIVNGNRYHLVSVDEVNTTSPIQPKSFKLEYDQTILPWRWSPTYGSICGFDHWGYYNGEKPKFHSSIPLESIYKNGDLLTGLIDRSPNPLFTQAGVLKKIIYPTGGFTLFEYENNDYRYTASSILSQNKIGGGLRIKRIESYDGIDPSKNLIERFFYEKQFLQGFSSGVIDNEVQYAFYFNEPGINITQWFDTPFLPIDIGYSEVKVQHANGSYTYYNYTTSRDYPYQFSSDEKEIMSLSLNPSNINYRTLQHNLLKDEVRFDYMRGLLVQKSSYSSYDELLYREISSYSPKEISTNITKKSFLILTSLYPDLYTFHRLKSVSIGKPELITKYINWYDPIHDPSSSVPIFSEQHNYTYNDLNYNVATHTTYTSDGEMITDYFKYPLDYGTISNSATGNVKGLKILQEKNMISSLVEHYQIKKNLDNSNSRVVSGKLSLWNSDRPYPDKFLALSIPNQLPSTSFISSQVSGNTFIADVGYQSEVTIEAYDSYGNVKELIKKDGVRESYQYGYDGNLLVASVVNARSNEFFYTSFEDIDGNSVLGDCKTGIKSRLNGYSNTLSGLPPNTNFKLTYFKKIDNTWTPIEEILNTGVNTFLSFSLIGQVDEVRIYPINSRIVTYTHNPGIGMTSITDINNITTYYEYDAIGRLSYIKDFNGDILKKYIYNYKQ